MFVSALLDDRIERLCQTMHVGKAEAEELIERTDKKIGIL